MIVFDIETGPLPEEVLRANCPPFEPPPHPGKFDPTSVKYGNTKDEAKRAEKLEAAKQKHAEAVAAWKKEQAEGEAAYWEKVVSKAALSPLTGRVLAIGYISTDSGQSIIDIDDDEAAMLERFWTKGYARCVAENRKLVGHNSTHFDMRFIIRRSWICGVDVPESVFSRGPYLNSTTLVDTMELWGEPVKLNLLAKVFGVGAKTEGVDGGMFADLLKTDRDKAVEYLTNDVVITRAVAERMGVI